MEPHRPRRETPNYVLWCVVIALAVCVGNLASSYIKLYVARQRLSQYIHRLNPSMSRHVEQIKRQSETHEAELHNARARTPQGRQMAANCHDWQQELRQLDSPTVRDGVKRHCDAYEKYLERGY